jgi:hypothetical protein
MLISRASRPLTSALPPQSPVQPCAKYSQRKPAGVNRRAHPPRPDAPTDMGDLSRPVPATRKQLVDLQAAVLAALRKRDGAMVIGAGVPARWRLKEATN